MALQRGFTLIELLVVLVIIALFTGMVMLNVNSNDNKVLAREATRLIHLIELAEDEAILQGIELGLSIQADRYRFMRLHEKKWLPLTTDREFKEHTLDATIRMSVEIENDGIIHSQNKASALPDVVILSSGELTPFHITLFSEASPSQTYELSGLANGQLSLQSEHSDY